MLKKNQIKNIEEIHKLHPTKTVRSTGAVVKFIYFNESNLALALVMSPFKFFYD